MTLWQVLQHRVEVEPFNLVATILFVLAVIHVFLTAKFRHWAHVLGRRHTEKLRCEGRFFDLNNDGEPDEVSFWGKILHFFRRGGGGVRDLGHTAAHCHYLVRGLAHRGGISQRPRELYRADLCRRDHGDRGQPADSALC